jgi:thioredoxin-related protein
MSSIVSKLISILLMSDTKRERKLFPARVKYQILVAQKNRCAMCKGYIENLTTKTEIVPIIKYQIVNYCILMSSEKNLNAVLKKRTFF